MRILLIAHFQAPKWYTTSFIDEQVKAFVQLGHQVRVLVPIAEGKSNNLCPRVSESVVKAVSQDKAEYYAVRYLSLSKYGDRSRNGKNCWKVIEKNWARLVEDFSPDLIYAHTILFDGFLGTMIKKKTGKPLVIATHGGDLVNPVNKGWTDDIKGVCNQADLVISNSSKLKRIVEGCDVDVGVEVVCLGNGLSESEIESLASGADDKDEKLIIQVSNLVKSKNIDITIKAYDQILKKDDGFKLVIIGDGNEEASLKSLVESLNLTDRVLFTGRLTHEEVFHYMEEAMYFVMVSSPEALGVVYLEAMSRKCLTIGALGEGIEDVIINGENGFLATPGNPEEISDIIMTCHEDKEKRDIIRERGFQDVSGMTWENVAKHLIELFDSIM